jgi:hypothetical protein
MRGALDVNTMIQDVVSAMSDLDAPTENAIVKMPEFIIHSHMRCITAQTLRHAC